MITHGMGVLYPGACTSIHMNMLVGINPAVDTATLTEAERADIKEDATFRQFETGTQPCLQDTPSDPWIATVIRGQIDRFEGVALRCAYSEYIRDRHPPSL